MSDAAWAEPDEQRGARTGDLPNRQSTNSPEAHILQVLKDRTKDPRQLKLVSYKDKDLEKEWKCAMAEPKQLIKSHFSHLELCEHPLKVIEKASDKDINALHYTLSSLDPQYNPDIRERMHVLHRKCLTFTTFVQNIPNSLLTPWDFKNVESALAKILAVLRSDNWEKKRNHIFLAFLPWKAF